MSFKILVWFFKIFAILLLSLYISYSEFIIVESVSLSYPNNVLDMSPIKFIELLLVLCLASNLWGILFFAIRRPYRLMIRLISRACVHC